VLNFFTLRLTKALNRFKNIGGSGETRFSLIILFVMGCIFWLPSGVINLREQEMIFPLVGIALYLSMSIFFRINKAVGLLMAFTIVYTLVTFTPDAYKFFFMVILFAYLYQTVVLNYDEIIKHKALIYNLLCIFALLNVLWLILQLNGVYIFFRPKMGAGTFETGFFANRNEVSVFLAVCLPFFFRRWWHLGIIPVLVGLGIAQTVNGLIGAVLVLAIYGLILGIKKGYSKKMLITAVAVLMVVAVGSYMKFIHGGGIDARVSAFSKASELVKEKPLLGWGVNQGQFAIPLYLNGDRQDPRYIAYAYKKVIFKDDFKRIYLDNPIRHTIDDTTWNRLHNDYLQWTIDTGLIGLACLLLVIASHVVAFCRTRKRDVLIGLSVLCLLWTANAFFTFQIGRFAFLMVFFLALIQGAYMKSRRVNQ
jgi:O-antigen ligase